MDRVHAAERARAKAEELLESLDLTAAERQVVHNLYVSILGAVARNRSFWQKVEDGRIKPEVIPSAAAMLTAYTDELVTAMREGRSPPLQGGRPLNGLALAGTMTACIARDSVSAGDDVDAPHACEVELPDDVTVDRLVRQVVSAAELPRIAGGRATWCVCSRVPLAVMAQQWAEPRYVKFIPPTLSELELSGRTVKVHISYFAQQDPDAVFEVLRRLRLRAS